MRRDESPDAIVADYVVEYRGRGAFLSVDEYTLIREWLVLEPDPDQVLLVLSDLFEKDCDRSNNSVSSYKSLSYYNRQVQRLLKQRIIARQQNENV